MPWALRYAHRHLDDDPVASVYDILGASPSASEAVIKAAYRARAKELPPDAGGSTEQMAALNAALYQILHCRAAVDQKLADERAARDARIRREAEAVARRQAPSGQEARVPRSWPCGVGDARGASRSWCS